MPYMSFKHQLTVNVKLLQKAALIRRQAGQAQVLLLRRSSDALSRPDCWDLPGGNSEWPVSEQPSAADLHLADIVREIAEETGLQVAPTALRLDRLTYFSTFFDADKQIYTVIAGWLVDFADTNQAPVQISAEHQDFAWVAAAELNTYDFGGDKGVFVVEMIQQAFAKYQNPS